MQCFIASEPVSDNVFNTFRRLQKDNEILKDNYRRDTIRLNKDNMKLMEFKKNWLELKTQIVFPIENYSEEHDTEVAAQILKKMNKLEAGG